MQNNSTALAILLKPSSSLLLSFIQCRIAAYLRVSSSSFSSNLFLHQTLPLAPKPEPQFFNLKLENLHTLHFSKHIIYTFAIPNKHPNIRLLQISTTTAKMPRTMMSNTRFAHTEPKIHWGEDDSESDGNVEWDLKDRGRKPVKKQGVRTSEEGKETKSIRKGELSQDKVVGDRNGEPEMEAAENAVKEKPVGQLKPVKKAKAVPVKETSPAPRRVSRGAGPSISKKSTSTGGHKATPNAPVKDTLAKGPSEAMQKKRARANNVHDSPSRKKAKTEHISDKMAAPAKKRGRKEYEDDEKEDKVRLAKRAKMQEKIKEEKKKSKAFRKILGLMTPNSQPRIFAQRKPEIRKVATEQTLKRKEIRISDQPTGRNLLNIKGMSTKYIAKVQKTFLRKA